VKDLAWFRPDGKEMTGEDWTNPHSRCFGLRLAGDAIEEVDQRGHRMLDDTFLVLINAHHEALPFVLPAHRAGVRWEPLVDTGTVDVRARHPALRGGEAYQLAARTLALLRLQRRQRPAASEDLG
jgi:isoamylase